MKTFIFASIFVALTGALASAAELSVFRVCQDQRVIRTSDGAEAGHVEYIVVDPSSREVVSTVITGGVVGERFVSVPYESLRFSGGHDITLTEITRERLVSAPAIERTQISAAVIDPGIIERDRTHFHARVEGTTERNATERGAAVSGRANERGPNAEVPNRNNPRAEAGTPNSADAETRRQQQERANGRMNENRPNAAAEANQQRARTNAAAQSTPNATNPTNPTNATNAAQTPAAKTNKANAARPTNTAATPEPNTATPDPKAATEKSTKPTRDANDRSKQQQAERNAENARAQENEPNNTTNTKGERKGAADRNANEEKAAGRKPAEENATPSAKHAPGKGTPSGEEKRREEQRPQL